MSVIHHTFAPHVDLRTLLRSLSLLLRPWRWRSGPGAANLARAIEADLGGTVVLFSTGREALFAFLNTLSLQPGDEVIVQGYTCIVVVNAIEAAGATPVYADIDPDTLNLDQSTVEPLITERTKAIICQHTFGIPAPLKELRALCDERRILLIEDCAHILPDPSGPEDLARIGDAVLMSFGRDKAISGISGGGILVRNPQQAAMLLEIENDAEPLSLIAIKKLLLYPLIYSIARPLYGLFIGKALLKLARIFRLLPSIVDEQEKEGMMKPTVHAIPNACADLACASWKRRKEINDHRRMLTSLYRKHFRNAGQPLPAGIRDDLPLQKFPLFVAKAETIRRTLKKQNIHLHDGWTGCVICPEDCDPSAVGYVAGTDPHAEHACEQILSLPTHPTMTVRQAELLLTILEKHLSAVAQ